jgi:hypothetical protein
VKAYLDYDPNDPEEEYGPVLIALALLARHPQWRGGNGLVVFTQEEISKARALYFSPARPVLARCDRTGRDERIQADITHMRVDLQVQAPQ